MSELSSEANLKHPLTKLSNIKMQNHLKRRDLTCWLNTKAILAITWIVLCTVKYVNAYELSHIIGTAYYK